MKKTLFTALRAMCVGAMTLFAVSCYDDSALWSEIEDLDARLTALEEKLNTEVATLNNKLGALEAAYMKADTALLASITDLTAKLDALDGTVDGYVTSNDAALKAAIEEYKKADAALADVDSDLLAALATMGVAKVEKNAAGNVVITFVDESTVEVGKADSNANNTGLITVVNGKWAVVGADGKTTVLDAELHPDTQLAFKVNPDNNELNVSYDGGQTWEPTGVVVNDATTINVVTAFKESEDYVTLTVGGVEYNLPKYVADNSSLVAGRTDIFFTYGATKTIELMAEGVSEYCVMTKPDGWKAALDGTVLTVTAPAKELITMGAADLEGQVLVHATTAEGLCKIAKINVETGEAFTLSFADGNVNIFTAYARETTDRWGRKNTNFVDLYMGITSTEDLLNSGMSFEDYLPTNVNEWDELICLGSAASLAYNNNFLEQNWYEEGWYESMNISFPLAKMVEIVNSYSETKVEYSDDESYILWLVPQGEETMYEFDSALYTYTKPLVDFAVAESLLEDVTFNASFVGADEFIVGAVAKQELNDWGVNEGETYEAALEYYLTSPGGYGMPGGPFAEFQNGNKSALGKSYLEGKQTVSLADVMGYADMDTEYYVWLLPYNASKPFENYTAEDLIIMTCNTIAPAFNPDLKATLAVGAATTNTVTYTVTPPTGGKTAFEVIPATDFEAEYMVDGAVDYAAVAEYMTGNFMYEAAETTEQDWSISPSTMYYLVAYSLAGTEYGVNYVTFTTPAAVEYPNPDLKQWVFKSTYFDSIYGMNPEGENMSPDYCFDLGVSMAEQYGSSMGFTACFAVDYEDIYGESAAGYWAAPQYSPHTVVASDETSGVVTFSGMTIPYSNFNGTTCSFDFSELFMEEEGTVVVEATIVEAPITVSPQ